MASNGLAAFPTIAIRWDALDSGDWYSPTKAYYHAKLAQVMTAQSLADRVGGAADVTSIRVPAVRLDAARLAAQPPLLRLLYAPKNRAAAEPEVLAESYARTMVRWSPETGLHRRGSVSGSSAALRRRRREPGAALGGDRRSRRLR